MPRFGYVFVGTPEVTAALRGIERELAEQHLEAALMAGAAIIVEEARILAPRRTGQLAANIAAQPNARGGGRAEVGVGWQPEGFYGRYQEIGTSRHGAKPHIRPAFDHHRERVIEAISDELRRRVQGVGQ